MDLDGTEVVAIVDVRDYHEARSTIQVTFNMNKAHFFDAETENVIQKKSAKKVAEATV